MKRQILFRGWSELHNKWVEGDLMRDSLGCSSIVTIDRSEWGLTFNKVHPDSVGQFTGKTDIHGANVFDGQIDQYGRVVEYSNGSFILTDKKTGQYALLGDCDFIEITGNTFKPK
jgi:hypothetical protein